MQKFFQEEIADIKNAIRLEAQVDALLCTLLAYSQLDLSRSESAKMMKWSKL